MLKRLLLAVSALCLFIPGYSQDLSDLADVYADGTPVSDDEEISSVLAQSKDGKIVFYGSSHIGYGFHTMNSSDFLPARSKEVFLNLVKLGIYPAPFLGIELSVDAEHNSFKSNNTFFVIDDNGLVRQIETGEAVPGKVTNPISAFNYVTLNFPLLLKLRFGDLELGGGAEAGFNFAGRTWYRYSSDRRTVGVRDKGARLNSFTYGFVGMLSYEGIALFVKWYPKSSRLLPEGSADLDYMTFGIAFGL